MTCTREQLVVGGEFVTDFGNKRTVLMVTDSSVFWRNPETTSEAVDGICFALEHWTPHDPRADWRLNDLLVVWDKDGDESLARFAGIKSEDCYCFRFGSCSSTANGYCWRWLNARLATHEDIARLSPKPESWWAKKREDAQ